MSLDLSYARVVEVQHVDGSIRIAHHDGTHSRYPWLITGNVNVHSTEELTSSPWTVTRVIERFPAPTLADLVGNARAFRFGENGLAFQLSNHWWRILPDTIDWKGSRGIAANLPKLEEYWWDNYSSNEIDHWMRTIVPLVIDPDWIEAQR